MLDSGSADRTCTVARNLHARVIVEQWRGYAGQKNRVAEHATNDWVLSLDADEVLSEELDAEILLLKQEGFTHDGYAMPRMAQYLGRWIRHSGWYPDRKVRLYDRRKAQWQGEYVHESVRLTGTRGDLHGAILHFTCDSLSEHLQTLDRYTTLASQELLAKGERPGMARLIADPAWTFLRTFLLRRGLSGWLPGAGDRLYGSDVHISEVRQGSRMRTLHLDTGREMRGGQWQVLRLVRGLVQRGGMPTLMAPEGSPLFRAAAAESLPVRRLTMLGLPQAARNADLVHVHDARAHTMAALFPRAPLVVARRVAFPIGGNLLSRRKYARATHFIAVSRYVATILAGGGIPQEKISVVFDGVPLLPLAENGRQVICPASNDPQKGVRLVIEAARMLRVQVFPSPDLERDLPRAAVFVYVTYAEGLGSATLLAMSAGVPVVASAVGGLPEAITDGQEGFLVENQPVAISAAVGRLLADRDFANQMGGCGRRKVEAQFTEDLMINRTQAVYQKLLANV